MMSKKTIEVIKELGDINITLFETSDKLSSYASEYNIDFGLAYQYIRKVTTEIQEAMNSLCVRIEQNGEQ